MKTGRVYKIIAAQGNECYVGSTFNTTRDRFQGHKRDYEFGGNKCSVVELFDKYGIDNCKMILIKEYLVIDRAHLMVFELLWIKKLKAINRNEPFGWQIKELSKKKAKEYYKQYNEKNKEKIKEYYKQYNEKNKEKIKEYYKQYNEKNNKILRSNINGIVYTSVAATPSVSTMEKLKNNLIKISEDISQKEKILKREYKQTDLYKVWRMVLAAAPTRLSKSWNNLMIALQNVLKLEYTNPTTFNGVVSKFRKPIRENTKLDPEIYKQSLILLGRTKEEAAQQKEAYSNKVAARNAGRASYPVLYVEDLFAVMDKLIASNDPYDLVLAVELATASRSIEVLKVSKYFALSGQPNQIKILGLAKDKMARNDLKNVVIVRNLVHLTSDQVLEAIEEIRSSFDFENKTNAKISNLTNSALNKAFREHIVPLFHPQDEEYLKTLSSHKTRYISGYVSYLIHGKPSKLPEESYIGSQLGHLSADSTRSYLGINVQMKNKVIAKAPDDIKALFEHEIKQMKQQIDANCPDKAASVDLSEFKNSHRRTLNYDAKVEAVVNALKLLKEKKIKMVQRDLRDQLGYSGGVMSAGYAQARREGTI
jgi:hypothetical protein